MPVSTFVRGSGSGAAPAVDDSLFAAVKLALRIDGDEADALLSGNIAAAMECQSAFNTDPQSACKVDPPEWHGGGCPGSR